MMGSFKNHTFIYGLFNDALNSPVYRANSVEWWRVNTCLENLRKDAFMASFSVPFRNLLSENMNITQ